MARSSIEMFVASSLISESYFNFSTKAAFFLLIPYIWISISFVEKVWDVSKAFLVLASA